jgi:serralysin
VWTLEIVDSTTGSIGYLNHFSLQITFGDDSANGDDLIRGGTGSHDLIDYTGRNQDVTVTMQGGAGDGQAGESDNVGAGEADIEDAYGGVGNDTIHGTAGANDLRGLQGGDQIYGLGGNDILRGLVGADLLAGGDGNDTIYAGLGDDQIIGGAGIDWARFVTGPLSLSLTTGTSTGEGNDTLAEIENVLAPVTNDTLVGDGNNNILNGNNGADTIKGEGGNDTLIGGGGADQLDGGPGFDWTNYASAPSGVTVDLTAGTSTGGHGPDTLVDIEWVRGSRFADTITGSDLANLLEGAEGNDTIYGLAGNDKLNGGPGSDALDGGPGTDTCLEGESLTDCE